jgi:hypothetical protein
MVAIVIDTSVQRTIELLGRPIADSRLIIGGDVGG